MVSPLRLNQTALNYESAVASEESIYNKVLFETVLSALAEAYSPAATHFFTSSL
jgi:hypothetical protein